MYNPIHLLGTKENTHSSRLGLFKKPASHGLLEKARLKSTRFLNEPARLARAFGEPNLRPTIQLDKKNEPARLGSTRLGY
ncbi:hypothetical protein Hanom_Chr17g01563931 [Helianthus anomalus]